MFGTTSCLKRQQCVKTEKLKFQLDKFLELIPDEPKCPTTAPHQEAIASFVSDLNVALREYTKVVESPTRPWSEQA